MHHGLGQTLFPFCVFLIMADNAGIFKGFMQMLSYVVASDSEGSAHLKRTNRFTWRRASLLQVRPSALELIKATRHVDFGCLKKRHTKGFNHIFKE